jgi:hypothetical protein
MLGLARYLNEEGMTRIVSSLRICIFFGHGKPILVVSEEEIGIPIQRYIR